jgi:hypothetical protein
MFINWGGGGGLKVWGQDNHAQYEQLFHCGVIFPLNFEKAFSNKYIFLFHCPHLHFQFQPFHSSQHVVYGEYGILSDPINFLNKFKR